MRELARQGLMEAGEAWQKNNETLVESNQAAADFQDTMAQMSDRISPVLTAVQNGVNLLLGSLLDMTEQVDFSVIANGISDGFGYVVDKIFPALQTAFGWVVTNSDSVAAAFVGIGTAMGVLKIAAVISNVVSGFSTFFSVIQAGQGVMAAFNAVLSVNPILLIVSAVAALVAGFLYLWNTCDEFREFWINLGAGLVSGIQTAIETIVGFFTVTIPQAFQNAVTAAGEFLSNVGEWFAQLPGMIWGWLSETISGIGEWAGRITSQAGSAAMVFLENVAAFFSQLPGKVGQFLSSVIQSVISFAAELGGKALEAGRTFFDNLVNTLSQLPSRMLSIGGNIVQGIWSGISGAASWLWNQIAGFCSNIVNNIKNFFGIHSPSTLMEKVVGRFLPPGIAVGFESAMPQAIRDMDISAGKIATAIPQAMGYDSATRDSHDLTYTFGPGSIVIHTQATNGRQLYKEFTREMQREVRGKGAAYGHS